MKEQLLEGEIQQYKEILEKMNTEFENVFDLI